VTLHGKEVAAVNKEFIDKLPDQGLFEGTYVCAPENIKLEIREKLGCKYLDWSPVQ